MNTLNRFVLELYGLAWTGLVPFLSVSPRIRQGIHQRLLMQSCRQPFDLWIQAASGGEAYLALELIRQLSSFGSITAIITSCTAQGMSVLKEGIGELPDAGKMFKTSYLPFDMPWLMQHALGIWRPRLVVLLETEMWPGMMAACRKAGIPVIILNGRLSRKSLNAYMKLQSFWKDVCPERICAISPSDAQRFARLFGMKDVSIIHNIKFDRIDITSRLYVQDGSILPFIPRDTSFVVMGSVRREEEKDIAWVIEKILSAKPDTVIGLFPRHMHRIRYWKQSLDRLGVKWVLRSLQSEPVDRGTVVLWDTFGELNMAYSLAQAVFVGGSLRPCGGQNFLEPLSKGVVPCIGPFFDNFAWVGEEIFKHDLVIRVKNRDELLYMLIEKLTSPLDRAAIMDNVISYVRERQGGTLQACQTILDIFNTHF